MDIFTSSEFLKTRDDFLASFEHDDKGALPASLMEQFMLHDSVAAPDLQANYGTPAALKDDVIAHYAPLPAIVSARFIDIVSFRGLPTYRVTLAGEGPTTMAYYLVRPARRRLVANRRLRAGAGAEQLKFEDANARSSGRSRT
jgi:hypothetical protein